MLRVPTAIPAVLLKNDLLRGRSLVLGRRVVPALAGLALEGKDNSVSARHEVLLGAEGWRL